MDLMLSASPERLRDKFFSLQTKRDVADLLEIDVNTLNYHLYRVDDSVRYTTFGIPKKSGGVRTISAPATALKIIQRKLNQVLQLVYEPHSSTYGFVRGRNIVDNAKKHCSRRFMLNIDLMDFFPSINFGRVRGLFMGVPYQLNSVVATILAQICCFDNAIPQGAPTSPIIANMISWRMDRQLRHLARQHRCSYTRYADDVTFSTSRFSLPTEIVRIISPSNIEVGTEIVRIIEDNGFSINPQKVRFRNNNQRLEVTGLTTNVFPNVQRKYIRNIRAMLHAWQKFGLEAAQQEYFRKHNRENRSPYKSNPSFDQIVKGKINFLGMVRGKKEG